MTGLLAAGAVGWLVFRPSAAPASTGPAPGPAPVPTPITPAPPTYLVGDWCSQKASDAPPAAISMEVVEAVNEKRDVRLPLLWLMIALYVTKYTTALPTAQRLRESSNDTSYDDETRKALEEMLKRPVGADKRRDLIDAYLLFTKRLPSDDVACPVTVPSEFAAGFQELLAALAAETGVT